MERIMSIHSYPNYEINYNMQHYWNLDKTNQKYYYTLINCNDLTFPQLAPECLNRVFYCPFNEYCIKFFYQNHFVFITDKCHEDKLGELYERVNENQKIKIVHTNKEITSVELLMLVSEVRSLKRKENNPAI
jgi:hypothetical protein